MCRWQKSDGWYSENSHCILSAFSPALAQKEARVAIVLPFKATGEEGRRSLDFYRGFLLAADHLKSQGISARITALDEGQESAYIEPALNAAAPSADALVGFTFHSHALEAARFGLSHEMPVVFPLAQSIKTGMESNAYAAFLVPDDEAWAQGISQMLTGALGRTQVLVLQSETTEMSQRTQRLTELLDKSGAKVKVLPISATPYNIADALSSKRMNLVVTAATEKDILRNVAQKLRSVGQANPKKTLAVVGHPAWYDYYKTGEVGNFNAGLLDKHRILAVTKSDLLDEELIEMLSEDLPDDLPVVFISAVSGKNMQQLKDMLWEELNSESNKLQSVAEGGSIVHRDRDISMLASDFAGWQDDFDDDSDEPLDDYDMDEVEEYDLDEVEDLEDYVIEEVDAAEDAES